MARPKLGEGETERLHVKITSHEMAAIDEWRFENRISSRSEAVRRLCQIGMLVEAELEGIVDEATDALRNATSESGGHLDDILTISHGAGPDQVFKLDDLLDLAWHAASRLGVLSDDIEKVQIKGVALYNAIASLVEASSLGRGTDAARERLAEANEVLARAAAKREESAQNRYLSLIMSKMSAEQQAEYEALTEEEQDEFWEDEIGRFREEEQSNPAAFAKAHDLERFWQKGDWPTFKQGRDLK